MLVIADVAETKTAGGILLTSGGGNAGPGSSATGVVKSVGSEVTAVKSGDNVLVNGFAGTEVEFEDGTKGKFLTTDDIIAVLS